MREIKFRAWDNVNKKWILGYEYESLGGFSLFGECVLLGEWSNVLDQMIQGKFGEKGQDLIVMQYTGLKDKNGSEIYEGDWIVWNTGKYKCLVEFKDGCWKAGRTVVAHLRNVEVSGNIYENPELLN